MPTIKEILDYLESTAPKIQDKPVKVVKPTFKAPIDAPIRAVLFDMDGLLIDSEKLYTQITNELLEPYGQTLTWALKAKLMGRPALESASVLIKETGIDKTPEQFVSAMSKRQQELFPRVPAKPGAIKLVQHLAKHVPIAIATASSFENFRIKASNPATFDPLFAPFGRRIVCGDDIQLKRGKPSPDIFIIAALRHFGINWKPYPELGFYLCTPPPPVYPSKLGDRRISVDEILVFEDGVLGIHAAKAAGMKSVWVAEPELLNALGPEAVSQVPADVKLSSLEDWVPEDWGLPPY